MATKYIERMFKEPDRSYFLFGPRGTGKSTMVEHRHPGALFIDLRIPQERLRFLSNPDLFTGLVSAQPSGQTIVVDEIQKAPELLSLVHLLIEKKRQWKFILTGSSARKLKRQGIDLLGGRALNKVLNPFIAAELQERFNLESALRYGLLPLSFEQKDHAEILEAYIALYMEEEIQAEGLIRNSEPFARFLSVMSFSHASLLNVTNISRECGVKRTTVSSWISILEDLLIGFQLSVFTERAKRELSAHPKFYFFDAGVYRSLRPHSLKDTNDELDGAALEGLVAQHLMAWNDYSSQKHAIHFWRTRSGVEVDFVVLGPLGFWAIEVKNSDTIRVSDIRHLESFKEDYPQARALVLYRGHERLLIKNVLCLPCTDFLKQLVPDTALDTVFKSL